MTSVTFYKNIGFDGVNSFPYFTDGDALNTFLETKKVYTATINYNKIGDPILIGKDYDTAVGYQYGRIDTASKSYFIVPTEITVNESNRTQIEYTVDWYTTLLYDGNLTFGRSHLIKSSSADPLKYEQGIQPIDMVVTSKQIIYGNPSDTSKNSATLFISYIENTENSKFSYLFSPLNGYNPVSMPNDKTSLSVYDIFDGNLFNIANITPANIVAIWYVPFEVLFMLNTGVVSGSKMWYKSSYPYPSNWKNLDVNLITDATHIGVITDTSGNIIYSVPYGRTLSHIKYRLIASWTQCYIEFVATYTGHGNYGNALNTENSRFLSPCQLIDFNSDTYKNWAMGLKGIEIEERRIQKNKNLVQGVGGSTLTGAIGGASGSPLGALAGIAGGVGSAVLSYGIDTYYESSINRIEDKKYQLAPDTIVPGSFLTDENYNLSAVQLSALSSDIDRYNSEIQNFGADCNLPVPSWTPSPGAYKFGDVEIVSNVPYNIKQSIRSKFLNGIKIVDVTQ